MFVCVVAAFLLASTTTCVAAVDHDNTYNYFDFVRQWIPNSCYEAKPACAHIPEWLDYWTLHGLWPSKDATHYPASCAGSKCYLNETSIRDLEDEMHKAWISG